MVKFFRVKEKARGLARQQKYDQALAEYRAAITQAESQKDVAALRNLYNAAGDAALQKKDSAMALEFFEKAAALYLEEGLYDNAIALCHKILRHVPTKAEVYATLGRIYAEKGLRAEAIQNWLEYAERREKASDAAGVIRALREVVALSPESDSVRQQLADMHLAQGQPREALTELEELERRADLADDAERSAELARRIDAARRDSGTAEEPAAAPRAGPPGFPGHPAEEVTARPERPAPAELRGARAPAGDGAAAGGIQAGRDAGAAAGLGHAFSGPGLTPPGEMASREPAGAGGQPRGGRGGHAGEVPPIGALPGFTPPEPSLTRPDSQPTLSPPEPGAGPPALEIAPRPFVPVEERIARAEARLADDPANAEERIYLGELYQEAGSLDLARAAIQQGARDLFQSGLYDKAYRAYHRLALLSPGDTEIVRNLVEVAQASGEREQLLQAYELLGDRLMEAGQYGQAAEIHRRILEIDPAHRHSRDQLLILEGLEGTPAPGAEPEGAAATAGRDEYPELAELVTEAASAIGEPSPTGAAPGEEERDLRAIVEALRRGVPVNIEEGDFTTHYDLGVAFRDTGLVDEAIREFQLAARGGQHRQSAFELMGLCFMEKGMPSVAVNCFRRGIESERDPYSSLGLHYHLGRSLEELGDPAGAREEYEKVVALNMGFMDVAERLRRLA